MSSLKYFRIGILVAFISYLALRSRLGLRGGERSVAFQLLKYFARPHDSIPTKPLENGAYWLGSNLSNHEELWKFHLNDKEVDCIRRGVMTALSLNKPLKKYVAADLPLPQLELNISQWRKSLDPANPQAIGVVIIQGVPVQEWSVDETSLFWWCFGLHLGIPGAQNGRGELLGDIKNEFYKDIASTPVGEIRQYRTNEAIGFHCDAADVVGLICLKSAGISGGNSRLASSVTVFNIMQQRRPDLVPALFQPTPLDTRGDGGLKWFWVTPAKCFRNILRTFWHSEYFLTAFNHMTPPSSPSDLLMDLVQTYDSIANEPGVYLETKFDEGDIQLISNHLIIHARTSFEDTQEQQRHLLRLWLSLPTSTSWQNMGFQEMVSTASNSFEFLFNLIMKLYVN